MASQKLVLYSGGQQRTNAVLHRAFVNMALGKKKTELVYIPYCKEGSSVFFKRFVRRYRAFGATHFWCLPVDDKVSQEQKKRLLRCNGVYLAGGNTFYFLKHLKQSGVFKVLKELLYRGKVIAGLSAGALILTPHIELAAFPPYDEDENFVKLKRLTALGAVPFEFLPHYNPHSYKMKEAMLMYSHLSHRPIYACEDGGGIIINGIQTTFVGSVYQFYKGQVIRI
ncbi:MAG: hypothetical protein D6797_08165 [Bdellovibrio sp.]|nr:MAG: hypothetical protein D6797_08165 [Bdellovibrio sp.]